MRFSVKNIGILVEVLVLLARSYKIVHVLGALSKNLVKIVTKIFKNLQDSWQKFQDILHWVSIDLRGNQLVNIHHDESQDISHMISHTRL